MTSLLTVVWAAPAALGFAMLFNVRRRALPIVALIAVLAKAVAVYSQQLGATVVAADFLAACLVGALAFALAPRLGEASPVFAFAPVIPLIPGAVIAKAFLTSFSTWVASPASEAPTHITEFVTSASTGMSAAAMVLALCVGAITPMLLLPSAHTVEQ